MMTRTEVIDELWRRNEPDLFMTKDDFVEGFKDWHMILEPKFGDPKFVAFVKGAEFHYAALEQHRSLSLRVIRSFLGHVIASAGHALTRTPKDDIRQRRFNEAIGFVVVGEDEFFVHYKIERVQKCQS